MIVITARNPTTLRRIPVLGATCSSTPLYQAPRSHEPSIAGCTPALTSLCRSGACSTPIRPMTVSVTVPACANRCTPKCILEAHPRVSESAGSAGCRRAPSPKRGHECTHAAEIGMSRATDPEILAWSLKQEAAVVTLDADFHGHPCRLLHQHVPWMFFDH
jgi:Domain of unknown function (DUF5615)